VASSGEPGGKLSVRGLQSQAVGVYQCLYTESSRTGVLRAIIDRGASLRTSEKELCEVGSRMTPLTIFMIYILLEGRLFWLRPCNGRGPKTSSVLCAASVATGGET
jgi:hypothetical protein